MKKLIIYFLIYFLLAIGSMVIDSCSNKLKPKTSAFYENQ